MDSLDNYQNAAEIVVQLVYGIVFLAVLAGAVIGIRFLFNKRSEKPDAD